MNCEKVRTLLGRFYDCNLDRHSEADIESHLANCPSCSGDFERLQKLGGVLQKGFIPAPSVSLDELVMREIRRESELRQSRKITWRQRIFSGSVSVPKPAFAVALILIIAGLMLSNLLGRNAAANFIAAVPDVAPNSLPASTPPQSNESDRTKIVEAPIVRERVVKQIVYVERQNSDLRKDSSPLAAFRRNRKGSKDGRLNESLIARRNAPNLEMKDSISENGYFTRVNLSGFKPAGNARTRIIKENEINEK